MEKELIKVFQKSKYEDSFLADEVWNKIVNRNKYLTRIKIGFFSIISLFSLAGLIPAVELLSTDLSKSGFYEYINVAFSDGQILVYWQDLFMSVAEALPTLSIVLPLTLVLVLFLSLRYMTKHIIKNQLFNNFNLSV